MKRAEREVEIKLAVASATAGRRLLRRAGFHVSRRRVFEDNVVFDTSERRLVRGGSLLRVRRAGGHVILTFKGPAEAGQHKSREELEIEVGGGVQQILDRLGFSPVFRYQKYRTEFCRDGSGVATLDETPIGVFLELEGPPRWIDRAARALGFTAADYITASYGRLYLESCQRRGRTPGDMLFTASRRS